MTEKVLFNWSSGKDSARALYELQQNPDYEVVSLLTTVNSDYGRISMHGVREELVDAQADSLGLPLEKVYLGKDATNDDYEKAFREALGKFTEQGVELTAFGDLYLEDLRKYREDKLALVGMKGLFPLWRTDTDVLAKENLDLGFRTIVTCVDTIKVDPSFSGREITVGFLEDLPDSVDPCGENGEFHSFVIDGPNFKTPINVEIGEQVLKLEQFFFTDLLLKS